TVPASGIGPRSRPRTHDFRPTSRWTRRPTRPLPTRSWTEAVNDAGPSANRLRAIHAASEAPLALARQHVEGVGIGNVAFHAGIPMVAHGDRAYAGFGDRV